MPVRRLKKTPAHLEITAFINLIVVLVPFLLSIAVFTHLAVMDLSLPAQSSTPLRDLKVNDLKLEVVIRPNAIDVSDQLGGNTAPDRFSGLRTRAVYDEIRAHGEETYPYECCGALLGTAIPNITMGDDWNVVAAVRAGNNAVAITANGEIVIAPVDSS